MKVSAILFCLFSIPSSANAFVQLKQPVSFSSKLYGWNVETTWDAATVTSVSDACSNSICLSLDVGKEKSETYEVPGQYCQVKVAGDDEAKPAFLAVASAPKSNDDGVWEFLIKKTDNNSWLTDDLDVGSKVDVSQILGKGFQTEEHFDGFKYDFPVQRVLLFAAGSGIAPIRAAIESDAVLKAGRSARLYYGCRSLGEMAYKDKLADWEARGVEIVPVISQSDDDFKGRMGYCQTALEEDGIPTPRNCGALLCGMKGMTEAVSDLLKGSGMFEGRILQNF